MELDFAGAHAHRAYAVLTSLVTPRPIALVTTVNAIIGRMASPDGYCRTRDRFELVRPH